MRRLAVLLVFTLVAASCGGSEGGTSAPGSSTTSGFGGTTAPPDGSGDDEPVVIWVSSYSGQVARLDLDTQACEVGAPGISNDLIAFGLGRVWVADCAGQQLLAIDVDTGEVVGRRDLGGCASDIAVGTSSVFVTIPETATVLEIDAATGEILDETPVAGPPSAIALGSTAVGTFDGLVTHQSAATGWDYAMAGIIYDLQFYAALLWVLEVEFAGPGHDDATSRIWTIDPAVGEPVLYAELAYYLNGILVTDFGIWANSLAQDSVARWDDDTPGSGAAAVEPRWTSADSPSKVRLAGDDGFTTHHSSQRVTRIDQAAAGHDWGAPRNGVPPSLWDQPGTTHFDVADLCDPALYPSDVTGATAPQLASARTLAAGYPVWESDPAPAGPTAPAFFTECHVSHSDGTVTASGLLADAADGATVELSLHAPDAMIYPLGSLPIGADGTFEFPPVEAPIAAPFIVHLESGGAVCEVPIG